MEIHTAENTNQNQGYCPIAYHFPRCYTLHACQPRSVGATLPRTLRRASRAPRLQSARATAAAVSTGSLRLATRLPSALTAALRRRDAPAGRAARWRRWAGRSRERLRGTPASERDRPSSVPAGCVPRAVGGGARAGRARGRAPEAGKRGGKDERNRRRTGQTALPAAAASLPRDVVPRC